MTDKPHTPTTEQVRFAATFPNENFSVKGTDFDRWLAERDARIRAAAEQRGAEPFINMIERVAEHPSLIGTQTAQDTKQLLDSIQANHTEGDDADA